MMMMMALASIFWEKFGGGGGVIFLIFVVVVLLLVIVVVFSLSFRNRCCLIVLRCGLVFGVDGDFLARGCGDCVVPLKCWECCWNSRPDNPCEHLARCCS